MQYPFDDLDRPEQVLRLLSSYWVRTYEGQGQIRDIVETNLLQLHAVRNLQQEAELAIARRTTPPFRKAPWGKLKLLRSEANSGESAVALFGEGYVFGSDLIFGAARPGLVTTSFPFPVGIARLGFLSDLLERPSVVLFPDIDFTLDPSRDAIVFDRNPFADERLRQEAVFENGVVVDYAITLWMKSPEYDEEWLRKLWGYIVEVYEDSSEAYRSLLNAVFDALVGGGVASPIYDMLTMTTDIPLAKHKETIELIGSDAESKLIVTDKSVYRFSSVLEPVVAVGDSVRPGKALTNGLSLHFLKNGTLPADLKSLTLDTGFIKVPGVSALVFVNEDVALEVNSSHPSGYTYISYPLGGTAAEAKAFFDSCHARGIAAGGTLAQLLDLRESPDSEPTAASLPTVINPLQFAAENWLRNNAAIARISLKGLGRNALGVETLGLLLDLLPPRAALVVVGEWTTSEDTAVANDAELSFGYGWEPRADSGSLFDGGLKFTVASEYCS